MIPFYHQLTFRTLQLFEISAMANNIAMHVSKHCWYVITCIRLELNPTFYSLTVQNGASPLYVASEYGHSDVVDILLQAGADVHKATTKV